MSCIIYGPAREGATPPLGVGGAHAHYIHDMWPWGSIHDHCIIKLIIIHNVDNEVSLLSSTYY